MKKKLTSLLLVSSIALLPPSVFADSIVNNGTINSGTINNGGIVNNGTIVLQFNDIQVNSWAYTAISSMSERGVLNGYDDGSFRPDDPVSREEFAKMIAVTFSLDTSAAPDTTFSDVAPNRWSYPYVSATSEYITAYYPPKGVPFFDPTADATREDVATALVKIAGLPTEKFSSHFSDEDMISPGLKTYVDVAAEYNLISGYPDGTFRPQSKITRAEVASLLYRAIKGVGQPSTPSGPAEPVEPTEPPVTIPDNSASETPAIQAPDLHVDVVKQAAAPITEGVGTSAPLSVLVKGETTPGAIVTVNGENVMADSQGKFSQNVPIMKAGTYDYAVVATRLGQSTTVNKSITIDIEAPQLSLEQPDPQTMKGNTCNLWFDWTDPNDAQPTLYVNGEKRTYGSGGGGTTPGSYNGMVELVLQDGENDFTLKVVNKYGVESNSVMKVIFYEP